MATAKVSKKSRVLKALKTKAGVTRQSALAKFDVKNLRATIAELRNVDNVKGIQTLTNSKGVVKYAILG